MENFINDLINFEEFEIDFSRLWYKTLEVDEALQEDLKRVENLQLDPRSAGFGSFLTFVFRQFEVLENENYTEQDVKEIARNVLRKIQP